MLKALARLAGNTNTKQNIIDRFVSWKNENCESLTMTLLKMYQDKKVTKDVEILRVSRIVMQRLVSRCSDPSELMKRACNLMMKGSNDMATTIIGSAPRNMSIEYETYERLINDKSESSDVAICLASRLNKEKDETMFNKVLKHVKDEKKLVWIAKALILRGHRYANITISKVSFFFSSFRACFLESLNSHRRRY